MEQILYNIAVADRYKQPIVDMEETRKYATAQLWGMRKNHLVKQENQRILAKHTLASRKPFS